jgi:hypothetical protein
MVEGANLTRFMRALGVDSFEALNERASRDPAWFHDALPDKPADFTAFLHEVDGFAIDEYLPILVKGDRAPADERQAVAERLGAYTGTSADYWQDANFRVTEGQFVQELLRSRGQLAGRVDSRFAGFTTNALAEHMPFDPYMSSVGPGFVATFNDYYRRDRRLKWTALCDAAGPRGMDYSPRPGNQFKSPAADTGVDSRTPDPQPDMKVLRQGYFDWPRPTAPPNTSSTRCPCRNRCAPTWK